MICKDSVAHYKHHLSRHMNSNRHKQIAKYLSQTLSLADQDESERASVHAAHSSDTVILDVDAPPIANGIPTEVCHGLDSCYRWLITFTG
jgi:hypothetical protein